MIRSLSATSNSRPLSRNRVYSLVTQIAPKEDGTTTLEEASSSEHDLEWLATGKATVQVYGLVLNTLLEQTIPLGESIWYWDEVLGTYAGTGLYTLQTSPLRFWKQAKDIYVEAKQKYLSNAGIREAARESQQSLAEGWREFYALVQDTSRDRSLVHARTKILSPFAICRTEARRKQNRLKRLRETSACAIGLLMDEGLAFEPLDEDDRERGNTYLSLTKRNWHYTVAKSISLLENLLRNASTIERSIDEFEESVFTGVEGDPQLLSDSPSTEPPTRPTQLASRLIEILDKHLPEQERSSNNMATEYGKPSRLIRYWIPSVALLLSGSTLLRIFANRRAEIITWVREFGTTVIDFWSNWVVEPSKKLIGTIRHDESSEVAIMSKDSLNADRASLERMVVDFAVDHPEGSTRYSEVEIAEIRSKVKEGDLTAVLRAYERDMQSPIWGSIRGDLVRALLIQVQKTKVDVEVAIGGIDALLKSQQLLFGFVGIAPGVLISYFVVQWFRGIFGNRKGITQTKKQGETVRVLRYEFRLLLEQG